MRDRKYRYASALKGVLITKWRTDDPFVRRLASLVVKGAYDLQYLVTSVGMVLILIDVFGSAPNGKLSQAASRDPTL